MDFDVNKLYETDHESTIDTTHPIIFENQRTSLGASHVLIHLKNDHDVALVPISLANQDDQESDSEIKNHVKLGTIPRKPSNLNLGPIFANPTTSRLYALSSKNKLSSAPLSECKFLFSDINDNGNSGSGFEYQDFQPLSFNNSENPINIESNFKQLFPGPLAFSSDEKANQTEDDQDISLIPICVVLTCQLSVVALINDSYQNEMILQIDCGKEFTKARLIDDHKVIRSCDLWWKSRNVAVAAILLELKYKTPTYEVLSFYINFIHEDNETANNYSLKITSVNLHGLTSKLNATKVTIMNHDSLLLMDTSRVITCIELAGENTSLDDFILSFEKPTLAAERFSIKLKSKSKKPTSLSVVRLSSSYFALYYENVLSVWDIEYGMGHSMTNVVENSNIISIVPYSPNPVLGSENVLLLMSFQKSFYAVSLDMYSFSLSKAIENQNNLRELLENRSIKSGADHFTGVPDVGHVLSLMTVGTSKASRERFLSTISQACSNDKLLVASIRDPNIISSPQMLREKMGLRKEKPRRASKTKVKNISKKSPSKDDSDDSEMDKEEEEIENDKMEVDEERDEQDRGTDEDDDSDDDVNQLEVQSEYFRPHGAEKLISESVASAGFLRCYEEISRGGYMYLRTFGHILALQILSEHRIKEILAPYLGETGGSLVKLFATDAGVPCLISILRYVIDLSEKEIVTAVRYALSLLQGSDDQRKLGFNIMTVVVSVKCNASEVIKALREMSFAEVLMFLNWVKFVAKDFNSKLQWPSLKNAWRWGCYDWAGYILDAHLTSCILVSEASILTELAKEVITMRETSKALQSLDRIFDYMKEGKRFSKVMNDQYVVENVKII